MSYAGRRDSEGLPNSYFKPIVGQGAFRYEQWGATAALTAGGARPYAFPFEPEVIGRSPQLVIGKWSDQGAVLQKLADYGMSATLEQLDRILIRSQRAGAARHRPRKVTMNHIINREPRRDAFTFVC